MNEHAVAAIFIICFFLFVLCILGEPDILDGLIKIMNKGDINAT